MWNFSFALTYCAYLQGSGSEESFSERRSRPENIGFRPLTARRLREHQDAHVAAPLACPRIHDRQFVLVSERRLGVWRRAMGDLYPR